MNCASLDYATTSSNETTCTRDEFMTRFLVAVKHAGYYATPSGFAGGLATQWTQSASCGQSNVLTYYVRAKVVVQQFLEGTIDRTTFVSAIARLRSEHLPCTASRQFKFTSANAKTPRAFQADKKSIRVAKPTRRAERPRR